MRRLVPLLLWVSLSAPAATSADPALPAVDDPPDFAMGQSQDYAVVIGIPNYPLIARPVAWAEQDARAMARFFLESRGVPSDRVRVLVGPEARRERIARALAEAGQATGPDGVVWLYFAGNAAASPLSGERLLLPVEASDKSLLADGLPVDDAVRLAGAHGAQVMVIADTGYDRGPSVEVDWRPPAASVTELTATRSGEVAPPLDAVKHGAFAYLLLGALRGWADGVSGPRDGVVTAAEALSYTTSALDAMGFDAQDPYLDYAGAMSDTFALVAKGRGVWEAAPVLPRVAGYAVPVLVSGGNAPQTQLVVVGPSAAPLSGFDLERVERECLEEARKVAETEADREEAAAVATQQASTSAAWVALQRRAAEAVALPAGERAPMIAAVETFLADAKALTVTRPAAVVTVSVALRPSATLRGAVECGSRSVALAARTTAVPVAEVKDADAMLSRLKPPPPRATTASPRLFPPSRYGMVWVPAGSWDLGSPASEEGRFDDEQRHRVTLTEGYWVGEGEVTQELWSDVTGSNPSKFKACGPDCPVEQVSWCDTVAFANALSLREGLRPAYGGVDLCASNPAKVTWDRSADGYRLPTEAEWEVAARGGETAMFFGSELDAMAWYGFNSGGTTHSVCRKQRNGLGLCDVIGNVWEWTWDGYGAYQTGIVTDPTGPAVGSPRVFRGGSWYDVAESERVALRNRLGPERRDEVLGVRLVRSAP